MVVSELQKWQMLHLNNLKQTTSPFCTEQIQKSRSQENICLIYSVLAYMAEAQFLVLAGVIQAHSTCSSAVQPATWKQQICQDWFLVAVSLLFIKWKSDESISKCTFNLDKNLFSSFNEKGLCCSRNVKNTTLPGMPVIASYWSQQPF